MGKVDELIKTLESIPQKREMKNVVGKLRDYSNIAALAAEAVTESIESREYIENVFMGAVPEKFAINIGAARSASLKLIRNLEGHPEKINEKNVSERFDELKGAVDRAQSNLKDGWKKSVENKTTNYGPLVEAALKAKMNGSDKFQSSLSALQREANKIPSSNDDVTRVQKLNESLKGSMSELGLAGKGGEFLNSAMAGTADALELRDPEVIEFLDKYALWKVISVGLK